MLEVKNITKNYGNFCAIKNINLEFEKGYMHFLHLMEQVRPRL